MESHRLRVKIGPHEFDAEGPPETVTAQFNAWKEMIAALPADVPLAPTSKPSGSPGSEDPIIPKPNGAAANNPPSTTEIFNVDERKGILSLRVHPTGDARNADAALLVIYGYKRLMGRDEVLVGHIKDSLDDSGIRVDRMDRTIGGYVQAGYLLKAGLGKGGKYRLTMTGLNKAETLVLTLSQQMA